MPVPTPPNKDLFKVTPPRISIKKAPRGPSKSTLKMSQDIRDLTEALKQDANTVLVMDKATHIVDDAKLISVNLNKEVDPKKGIFPIKKEPFKTAEHLTQSPFRDSEAMRKLQRELKKESDPKKPVKRAPRRKPAANKTTGEK